MQLYFCVLMFLIFEIFSPQIVMAYGGADDPSLAAIAVTGMRIYGLMTAFVGMQMVGANFSNTSARQSNPCSSVLCDR